MKKADIAQWLDELARASFLLYAEGDQDGQAFIDEWAYLVAEFVYDMPIQRKPY